MKTPKLVRYLCRRHLCPFDVRYSNVDRVLITILAECVTGRCQIAASHSIQTNVPPVPKTLDWSSRTVTASLPEPAHSVCLCTSHSHRHTVPGCNCGLHYGFAAKYTIAEICQFLTMLFKGRRQLFFGTRAASIAGST